MYCRSPIPLGGRVHPNLSSGRSFSWPRSSLDHLGRGALSGIWALAPHPRCLSHGNIQSSIRSVIPQVGPVTGIWRDPVLGGVSAMERSTRPKVLVCRSVGRYIRPVRWSGLRCPGENRVRREPGVPDITHRPLFPWPMASAIGQGTSWFAGFVYTDWYVWIWLCADGYGGIRLGLVRYGWVRLDPAVASFVFVLVQPE